MWAETIKFIAFCITMLIICSMAIDFTTKAMIIKKAKVLMTDDKEMFNKAMSKNLKNKEEEK